MATITTRLGLRKPAGSDSVSVTNDIDNNLDALDAVIGTVWASTSTRPSTPFQGEIVTESDNGGSGSLLLVHNGSSPASGGWIYPRGSAVDCTSTTRPSKGPRGLLIRESDTTKMLVANTSNPASGAYDQVLTGVADAQLGAANKLIIGTDTPAANLYRSATSTLKTDGSLQVAGSLTVTGAISATGVGAELVGVVASDVTVNNSTVLVNATGLAASLVASATYILDGWIYYTSGTTPAFKLGWTFPTGLTGSWASWGPALASASRVSTIDTGVVVISSTLAMSGDSISPPIGPSARLVGYVTTSTTAGLLQLQFAQNTAAASNTVLKAGSWIRLRRTA